MALKDIKASDFKRSRSFSDLLISFAKNSFTDDVSSVKNDNSIKQAIKNSGSVQLYQHIQMEPFKILLNGRMEKLKEPPIDAVRKIAENLKALFDQLLESCLELSL